MAIETSKVTQIVAKHPTKTPHLTDEAWDGWCGCIGRTATVWIVTSNSEPTAREGDALSLGTCMAETTTFPEVAHVELRNAEVVRF